jgi:hypothetical protein
VTAIVMLIFALAVMLCGGLEAAAGNFRRFAGLMVAAVAFLVLSMAFHDPRAQPLFVRADWRQCAIVKPGPLERPDGYTTQPFGRKKDDR